MSKSMLPMESYRLAEFAAQIPCYICGEGNTFDAELCHCCQAPMALRIRRTRKKSAHAWSPPSAPAASARPSTWACSWTCSRGRSTACRSSPAARFRSRLQQTRHLGACALRVPAKDAQRARPLELGALPGQHARAPQRRRADHARHGRRSDPRRGRSSAHLPRHPLVPRASARGILILIDAVEAHGRATRPGLLHHEAAELLERAGRRPQARLAAPPGGADLQQGRPVRTLLRRPGRVRAAARPASGSIATSASATTSSFAAGVAGCCLTRLVRGRGKRDLAACAIEPRGIVEPFEWLVKQMKV